MSENDQYPQHKSGTFAPVGVILVVAISVLLGIFVYARSERTASPPPSGGIEGGGGAPNPNHLTPTPPPPPAS